MNFERATFVDAAIVKRTGGMFLRPDALEYSKLRNQRQAETLNNLHFADTLVLLWLAKF
jgi:hypothetical protein